MTARRTPLRLALAILAVTAALAGYAVARLMPEPALEAEQVGRRLPEAALLRLDGGRESLLRYAGKTLVINVWATWCGPCRRELPSLQRLSATLDPGRFAVIGISVDAEAAFVREYLRDVGVRFPTYIDSAQDVTKGRLEVTALPTTLIVGPNGRIHQRIVGERSWDSPAVIEALQALSAKANAAQRRLLGLTHVNAVADAAPYETFIPSSSDSRK